VYRSLDDLRDDAAQLGLANSVQLQTLTRRDPDRAVAVATGQIVDRAPQPGRIRPPVAFTRTMNDQDFSPPLSRLIRLRDAGI
jgi:hypothetical protein